MLDPEKQIVCEWCDERILPDEKLADVTGGMFHVECSLRMVVGPLAHIERKCSCFVPGSTAHDPEELTRRDAARAAVAAWRLLHDSP